MYETLIVEKDGPVLSIVLNRPKQRNALCNAMVDELSRVISDAEYDEELRVLIITGAGDKAFMAGADINELTSRDHISGRRLTKQRQELFTKISNLPFVSIAAVNGFALGAGLELSLACSIRIAGENASFGAPEVALGIIPGDGATQRLPRIIGQGRALNMILTGERIDAQTALSYGLVTQVVPADDLMPAAQRVAQTIMSKAPLAVQYAKDAVLMALDVGLASGLTNESVFHALSCASSDKAEGVAAFLEKRTPNFTMK
jgi:enoyl-CoA hydratase